MESLLDDLGSLGLKFEFRRGVDWGYGRSLDKEPDGKSYMFFTPEAVERLRAIGALVGKPDSLFLNFGYTSVWKGMYHMSFYLNRTSAINYAMSLRDPRSRENVMYYLAGSCGDSGFGVRHLNYNFRPRTIKKFQKEIEDLVTTLRG